MPRSPHAADARVAVGLTRVAAGSLWFEGDVDGEGQVSVVQYFLEPDGNNCPCLRRSQQPKTSADPLAQTAVYQVEVQNVRNGTAQNPIFFAYSHGSDRHGSDAADRLQQQPRGAHLDRHHQGGAHRRSEHGDDPRTRLKPINTLVSTVRLNNCSAATSGQYLSC